MSKTKEQCLKDRDVNIDRWPDTRDLIHLAMDDYAQQQIDVIEQEAISFVGWIVREGYEVHSVDAWMKVNDNCVSPILTRIELFNLYKQLNK